MAHKTIALTTELREPWTHKSEEAFLRSQCTVPERAKFIARYNRNAPQGQFHSAVVSVGSAALVALVGSAGTNVVADGHTASNAPDLF